MSTPLSGKFGRVLISGTPVAEVMSWSFTPKSNNHAYASSSTPGFKKRVAGVKDGSGSVKLNYDHATGPLPTLVEGAEVTLQLRVNAEDPGDGIDVPAMVDDAPLEVDVNDGAIIGQTINFSSNGRWTGIGKFAAAYPPA